MAAAVRSTALLLLCAVAARAGETHELKSDDGHWVLRVPAAWSTRGAGNALLAVHIPGAGGLYVYDQGARSFLPRARAFQDRAVHERNPDVKNLEVRLRPLPHLRHDRKGEVHVRWYLQRRGRNLAVDLVCDPGALAEIEPLALAAARSVRTDLPDHPNRPDRLLPDAKYDVVKWEGAPWWLEPGVKRSARPLRRIFRDAVKSFSARHGKFRFAEGFHVLVHASGDGPAPLRPDGPKRAPIFCDERRLRLFAVPVEPEAQDARVFAREAYQSVWIQRYGCLDPWWAVVGESQLAYVAQGTGEGLPVVDERYIVLPDTLQSFPELIAWSRNPGGMRGQYGHCFLYMVLFHAGPRRYRKAYDDFLGELWRAGDPEAAEDRLRDVFAAGELREAALSFYENKVKKK